MIRLDPPDACPVPACTASSSASHPAGATAESGAGEKARGRSSGAARGGRDTGPLATHASKKQGAAASR